MASGSNAPFSGDHNDLDNVPELPESVTLSEYRSEVNRSISNDARQNFELGLIKLDYPDGFYDIFVDKSKISSRSGISVISGTNGKIQISKNYNVDDFENGVDSGWTGTGTSNLTAQSQTIISGSQTGEFTESNSTSEIRFPVSGEVIEAKVRADNQSSNSSDFMSFNVDYSIGLLEITFIDGGPIEVYQSQAGKTLTAQQSWNIDTTFQIKIINDFTVPEAEVIINGNSVGTFDLGTANSIDFLDIRNTTTNSGIKRNMFLDDIGVDPSFGSSGKFTSTINDLGYEATEWTPTADFQLNGQSIDYIELQDGNGNKIKRVTDLSRLGDSISISTTATSYRQEIKLSGDGTDTPVINSYESGLDDKE